jgi:hypothetical protein
MKNDLPKSGMNYGLAAAKATDLTRLLADGSHQGV